MNRTRFVFVGVAFIAGVTLRFLYLPWMEFKVDEFRAVGLAILNVHHPLVLTGIPSSIGIPNPPFFIYLLSLPVLFTADPVIVTGFVAALNIAGLLLFYLFLRRFVNVETAMWSVALLSTAPWAIMFSRKLWAQDLLVPCLILFLWSFFSHRKRPTALKARGTFAILAILTQLHMSAWFLLIPLVIFCVLFGCRLTLRHACLGVGCFVLLYLPYLLYVVREGFATFQPLPSNAAGSLLLHPLKTVSLLGSIGFPYLLGEEGHRLMLSLYPLRFSLLLSVIVAVCAVAAIFWPLVRWKEKNEITVFSALVILTVNVLYLLLGIPAFPHYHIILLPFLVLLFVRLFLRFRLFLAIVVLVNGAFSWSLLHFIREHPTEITGDYGKPYNLEIDRWQTEIERINVIVD